MNVHQNKVMALGLLGAAALGAAAMGFYRSNSVDASAREAQKPAAKQTTSPGHQHGQDAAPPAGKTPVTGEAVNAPEENTIFVPMQRQQLIGVRTVAAAVRPLTREIRAVGKVAYDETKLTHIHTKVTGYVEEVFADFIGKPVKRGEPLFTIYSPELVATQNEYLIARRAQQQLKDAPYAEVASSGQALVDAARERLRLWDVSEAELQVLEGEGKVQRALTVYSPVSGVVTDRMAYHHGRYVTPDMDLYTIVDLSRIWVLAEIYEYELPLVHVGQQAEVEFPFPGGPANVRGSVTFLYPFLNAKTRTAQVRLEFPNPGMTLRPEMFVNVRLLAGLGSQVAVPEDAVLDTGTQQYVFVDKGEGYFEPRLVKLGGEADGYAAILSGLKAGEKVVTAANFILDSESRLKGVLARMAQPATAKPRQAAAARAEQALRVEILEPKSAKVGMNTIRLSVKDAAGSPVEDAEVELTVSMPAMGGMAPMSSQGKLKQAGHGEYEGRIEIPVAWTWQTTVVARKGGKVVGTAQLSITAR